VIFINVLVYINELFIYFYSLIFPLTFVELVLGWG